MSVKIFPTPDAHLPDARPAARRPAAPKQAAPAASRPGPAPTRRPGSQLDDLGFDLLLEPGHGLVLEQTAELYPHIVNKLAVFWNDAEALDTYLNKLLFADRPGREGLDFKAASELAEVRDVRVRVLRNAGPRR